MNITPGEPVPPGFEDEFDCTPQIQKAIDQYKGNALVGIEYTVELHEEERPEPCYYCVLCDKNGDPRTIMQHWTSFNHRLKYLEKHFSSTIREVNSVKYMPNSRSVMNIIVQKLAHAIENHHGRLPLIVKKVDDFRRAKTKVINEINGRFHYDDRNGPNFLNVIDRSIYDPKHKDMAQTLQITLKNVCGQKSTRSSDNNANRESLDDISSDSDKIQNEKLTKKVKRSEQTAAYRVLPRVRRSPPFEEDYDKEKDKVLPTPKELSLQASHIAQERYKWEKYRCMLEIHLKQMETIQSDYKKNPEKHPLYPDEWKTFWNRRYKELQAEKKVDPNKYDYKQEWIAFWAKRIKELYNAEIDQKKKEIKIQLGLPENAEEKIDQLKEKYKVQVMTRSSVSGVENSNSAAKKNERQRAKPNAKVVHDKKLEVIDISDDEDSSYNRHRSRSDSRRSRSFSPPMRRGRKRSHRSDSRSKSPRSDDYVRHRPRNNHIPGSGTGATAYSRETDYYGSTYSRVRYAPLPTSHYGGHYRVMNSQDYPKYERSPSPHSSPASTKEEQEPESEGPLTIVAVLRLIAAFEDHLGSLGPKVVDCLGKALALEKVKANSADDMLLDDDHCVFFETIKEKLKGLLIAGMLDDQQKVRAVKKTIKNIAALIHQVNNKCKTPTKDGETAASTSGNEPMKKRKKIDDVPFDRQIVASKLAAALVKQGCDSVSTDDMDKLIFFFILMVKISKETLKLDGKPLQIKQLLPEIGIGKISTDSVASVLPSIPNIVEELRMFEDEVSALVDEGMKDDIATDAVDKENSNDPNSSMLESLTDSDLQTLLQNFKHLSTEEQHHLIAHLKKLESADPVRVEKLRKFVNLKDMSDMPSTSANASRTTRIDLDSEENSNDRPNTNDSVQCNTSRIAKSHNFNLDDEDEDDDYNFEEVFKAASRNVNRLSEENSKKSDTANVSSKASSSKSKGELIVPVSSSQNALTFNPAGMNISLNDTKSIIANLMGSLQQNNQSTKSALEQSNGIESITTISNQQAQKHQEQQSLQQKQQQQTMQGQANIPFYQQQNTLGASQQDFTGGYNPTRNFYNLGMNYNAMGGYHNPAPMGYDNSGATQNYQQWGNAQQIGNMYQIQQYPMAQQQTQQQSMNMYGRSGY